MLPFLYFGCANNQAPTTPFSTLLHEDVSPFSSVWTDLFRQLFDPQDHVCLSLSDDSTSLNLDTSVPLFCKILSLYFGRSHFSISGCFCFSLFQMLLYLYSETSASPFGCFCSCFYSFEFRIPFLWLPCLPQDCFHSALSNASIS